MIPKLRKVIGDALGWISEARDYKRYSNYTVYRLHQENMNVQKQLHIKWKLCPIEIEDRNDDNYLVDHFLNLDGVPFDKKHLISSIIDEGKKHLHPSYTGYYGDESYIKRWLTYADEQWRRGSDSGNKVDENFKWPTHPSKHQLPFNTKLEKVDDDETKKAKKLDSAKKILNNAETALKRARSSENARNQYENKSSSSSSSSSNKKTKKN